MSRLAFERAIRRSGLKPPSRHLALTIATWAGIADGIIPDRFQPALSTLEEATGLTRKSVRTHLDLLEEAGWIGRDRPTTEASRRGARTHYRLLIPAGAAVAADDEGRGGDPLPVEKAGEEIPQGGGAHPLAVGEEIPSGRGGDPLKSPLSSGSTHQSPRAGAGEHRPGTAAEASDGSTKKNSISSDLDAAADAARIELSKATQREVRPDWARKVAITLLGAATRPISDGRHAAYVRTAIRNETDLSRFLPTPTASSSRSEEAFLPEHPAEDAPAPPELTLHTTTKPRVSRTPTGQPPLLASVPDTGPPPVDVRARAAEARARMDAARTVGDAQ